MLKETKDKKETKETISTPAEATPAGSSTNTALLVVIIVLLLTIIIGASCWLGFKYWKSKTSELKTRSEVNQQIQSKFNSNVNKIDQTKVNDSSLAPQGLVYENKEFGFRVNLTPAWKNFRAETETIGGDFEVSRTCFFLPTKYTPDEGELPGYTSPFCISGYVAYSWDEAQRTGDNSLIPMGEEVGRNSLYVFVYSHFNGDMPEDVPPQAILDMQKIAEGLEVFEPSGSTSPTSKAGVSSDDSVFSNPNKGNRSTVDPDFQMSGVYYWNCKHRYTLTYPTAWSNNGMTFNSDTVILKGNQAQISIEAVPITVTETLQKFAEKQSAKMSGDVVWVESIDWNGETTALQVTYRNPDAMAVFWLSGSYGMVLQASGSGYNKEYDNIQKTIATLIPNTTVTQCGASLSKTSDWKPKP